MKELIFASGNKGKVKEVRKIFEDLDYRIIALEELEGVPEIVEDGDTFEQNALIKARVIFFRYKKPVIADDSGLMVEQLDGEPGVYSARYAGENCTYEDNNVKLLKELSDKPLPHPAKFVCCAVYLDAEHTVTAFGELPGTIIPEMRGTNGFGYDPVFLPAGHKKTLAELDLEEKNRISHRSMAFNILKQKMKERIGDES